MNRLSSAKSGDWSALDSYLRDVSKYPNLTDEETIRLGTLACQGDVDAQEKLVKSHLRLVVKIGHQYAGFGLPLADLIAEGNLGLIRAAELYNPKFGTAFSLTPPSGLNSGFTEPSLPKRAPFVFQFGGPSDCANSRESMRKSLPNSVDQPPKKNSPNAWESVAKNFRNSALTASK
jgi:hypothetical protein